MGPYYRKNSCILLSWIKWLNIKWCTFLFCTIQHFWSVFSNAWTSRVTESGITHNVMVIMWQYEKVLKFISTAKDEGATILCGGARPQVKYPLLQPFCFTALFPNFTTVLAASKERLLCRTHHNNGCKNLHANMERGSFRTSSVC